MRKQRRRSAPLFSLHRKYSPSTPYIRSFKPLTTTCDSTARFVSDQVRNPEYGFSHNEAPFITASEAGPVEDCSSYDLDTTFDHRGTDSTETAAVGPATETRSGAGRSAGGGNLSGADTAPCPARTGKTGQKQYE